ncbi:MAG: hypothetical protein V7L09_05585 [Nostoc sp.]
MALLTQALLIQSYLITGGVDGTKVFETILPMPQLARKILPSHDEIKFIVGLA